MANPFASAPWFHKLGHATNTMFWRAMPTPAGLGVLTTTGRRSGKQRVRALRMIRDGDRLYGVAMLGPRCAWLHNIRAHPDVRIKLGNKTHDATARELTADERDAAAAVYIPNAGWFDYADYANLMWNIPTREKVLRSHEELWASGVPVVFELKD